METVFVQLDPEGGMIVGYMGSPQDPDEYPNQLEMLVDDPRWAAWYESQPLMIQRAVPAPASD